MARVKIPDLLPGTDYVVQVRVRRDELNSKWSEKFEFTAIENSVLPKTPTNVTWVAANKHFDGEWDKVNKQVDEDFAKIIRYDVELEKPDGTLREVVPHPASDEPRQKFKLGEQKMQALFGQILTSVKFRVRAVSQNENKSAWSAPITASIGAPDAPTGAVVEEGIDTVKLSWTAPANTTNVDGYRVYVGSTAGFTPGPLNMVYEGTATTYTFTSSTYAIHYFKIRSFSRYGVESADLTASGTPQSPFIVDISPPGVPTGLTATLTNNANGIGARAAVSWTMTSPPDDLAGFWLRWRKVGDTSWSQAPYQKDDRSAIVELQSAFTNYEFQIAAVDSSANNSAWSATYTATSPANVAPANVTGLTSTAGKDSITYSWTPVADTDIKNYEVTFSTSATFASGNTTFLTGTASTLNVGGLTYGTTYYARVRAVDVSGLTSPSWSATDTETTGTVIPSDGQIPAAPTAPTVLGGLSNLYITWSPVTTNSIGGAQLDPVTYEVHLSTTTGFTPSAATLVTEVSGTSAIVDVLPGTTTRLSYGTTYYIKLKAKDRDGTNATASGQGSGQISKVASTDVTSIGADLIVPGTGFIAAIVMNTGGSIQSANWTSGGAGWKISPTGAEFNDAGSSIKAEAIKAGTLGGTSGSGVINIAAGTSLIFNGGYLKSNTYTGTTQASNPSGAGFYLGNDGIRIDQGIVSASALTAGTISGTNTITLSGANAKIVGTGFTLSGSGLTVTTGTIAAAAITLTSAFANDTVAATTVIDGGKITTGTIQSNTNVTYGGTTQPSWAINKNGAATFADSHVRGRMIVGVVGSTESSYIQSGNFVAGSAGWKIDATGNAEFQNGTFRGNIIATSGTFSGTISSSADIVGGTFRTASSGDRAELKQDAGAGKLIFYTSSGSFAGSINAQLSPLQLVINGPGAGKIFLESGTAEFYNTNVEITNGGYLDLFNGKVQGCTEIQHLGGTGTIKFDVANGAITAAGGTNIAGRFDGGASSTSLVFEGARIIAGNTGYNAANPTNANTKNFWALSVNGFGAYVNQSDEREKNSITDLSGTDAIEKVKGIEIKRYKHNVVDPDNWQYGIIAQQAKEFLPDSIRMSEGQDRYMVSYQDVWAVGFAATKELVAKNEALESTVADLEERLAALERLVTSLTKKA